MGELVLRCSKKKDEPDYVPSECLLYFIRRNPTQQQGNIYFKKLYELLAQRILRSCLATQSSIQTEVLGKFAELLALDCKDYAEQLDFYEIRFNQALKSLRLDVERKISRYQDKITALEDKITGQPKLEAEYAAGSFEQLYIKALEEEDYRLRLYAAINSLPVDQRRIIHMLLQEIPIDSKNPDVVTISKALGKSEKTIRTYRDKAYDALREALNEGEQG